MRGEKKMIPKVIHYCWFGLESMSKKAEICINSWKKYCPDYEIIEWNESNFNIDQNAYTKMCYEKKKYAFLTDYIRLYVLEKYGGIYMDTDVEIIKPLDDLLNEKAYFGFEDNEHINTGEGCGAEAHNPVIQDMLKEYDDLLDGTKGMIGCPILNTKAVKKLGLKLDGSLQQMEHCTVYPVDYFNPYDDPTGRLNCTSNTYSIHWYAKTWMSKGTVLRSKMTKPLHRLQAYFKKRK